MHIFVRIVSDLYLRRDEPERNCRSATRSLRDGCTCPLGQWTCRSGGYPLPAHTTPVPMTISALLRDYTLMGWRSDDKRWSNSVRGHGLSERLKQPPLGGCFGCGVYNLGDEGL